MSILIYVEGGGNQKKTPTATACRSAFHQLFEKVIGPSASRKFRVIASGARNDAYKDFCRAIASNRDDLVLLLVDSEDPVTRNLGEGWVHLQNRDRWPRPTNVTEDQAHLMVQSMESWFMADQGALTAYYGQGFLPNSLPKRTTIEQIPKSDVMRALEQATRPTKKGIYHKTRHGFAILELIDYQLLSNASPWAKRLFDFLVNNTR